MNLPAPRAIIFDWDNTLVDTWPVIHEALVATFTAMGHEPWTLETTKARVSKSMRDSFPEIFGDDWEKAGDIYQNHYRSNHLAKLHPLPGAKEVLERAHAKGLFSVVVSNKKGPVLRKEIEHIGWTPLFNNIIGANDAARDKPHAEPVLMAFDQSGITPGPHIWFVGDSEIDLECAAGTGCTAILYGEEARHHPNYTGTHYHGFPYSAHVHNHTQTLALLDNLAKVGGVA